DEVEASTKIVIHDDGIVTGTTDYRVSTSAGVDHQISSIGDFAEVQVVAATTGVDGSDTGCFEQAISNQCIRSTGQVQHTKIGYSGEGRIQQSLTGSQSQCVVASTTVDDIAAVQNVLER